VSATCRKREREEGGEGKRAREREREREWAGGRESGKREREREEGKRGETDFVRQHPPSMADRYGNGAARKRGSTCESVKSG